jgi:hypothetical protein
MVTGDPLDPGNPFCLDKVVENLPGTPSYDPSMPWVYKVVVFEDGTSMRSAPTSNTLWMR